MCDKCCQALPKKTCTITKPPTEAQNAACHRFGEISKLAKKLREEDPSITVKESCEKIFNFAEF